MTTFKISEFKKDLFVKKMTKFSNRASKLGIEFGYKLVDVEEASIMVGNAKMFYNIFTFEVFGDSPTINGYTFLAKIEPIEYAVNLVHTHSEMDFSVYRTATLLECEHCHTNRNRNFYYLIGSENGEVKMVGHNCLANYIDLPNAEAIAEFYSSFVTNESDFYEDDGLDMGERVARGAGTFAVTDFLSFAQAIVKRYGYVTVANQDASVGRFSTKSTTCNEFFSNKSDAVKPTAEDRAEALQIIEVVRASLSAKTNLNEYENNVLRLIEANRMKYDHAGYVVSILALHNRIADTAKQNEATKVSEHIGVVGGKIENIDAVVVSCNPIQTVYGTTHIYTFNADGNVIVYFSSKNLGLDANDNVTIIKATVKQHNVYNGKNQTIITRGKVEVK